MILCSTRCNRPYCGAFTKIKADLFVATVPSQERAGNIFSGNSF